MRDKTRTGGYSVCVKWLESFLEYEQLYLCHPGWELEYSCVQVLREVQVKTGRIRCAGDLMEKGLRRLEQRKEEQQGAFRPQVGEGEGKGRWNGRKGIRPPYGSKTAVARPMGRVLESKRSIKGIPYGNEATALVQEGTLGSHTGWTVLERVASTQGGSRWQRLWPQSIMFPAAGDVRSKFVWQPQFLFGKLNSHHKNIC